MKARHLIPHTRLCTFCKLIELMFCLCHPNRLTLIQLTIFVIGRMVRRRGPVIVGQLQQFIMDEWSRNGISQLRGDAQSLPGRHLSEWASCLVLRPMIFVVTSVLRTDVMKGNTGYRIAIDYEFITKTMPSVNLSFCDFWKWRLLCSNARCTLQNYFTSIILLLVPVWYIFF